jgi:hypothetical protein
MARAMELLRATWPGFSRHHLTTFLSWVDAALMPQMDYYTDVITPNALVLGRRALYGEGRGCVGGFGGRRAGPGKRSWVLGLAQTRPRPRFNGAKQSPKPASGPYPSKP